MQGSQTAKSSIILMMPCLGVSMPSKTEQWLSSNRNHSKQRWGGESLVRTIYVLMITGLALCPSGCQRHDADKHAVISVVLAKERAGWTDSRRLPCLIADVRKSPFVGDEQSIFSISDPRAPKYFKLCGPKPDSYYQIYDPEITGTRALVMLDYHCGGMCGSGSSVYLQRDKDKWKVTEEQRRWIS